MSQVPPKPAETKPAAPKNKGGGVLRVILIVLMLVMIGLLVWDRYARAASQKSFDNVVKWVEKDLEKHTPEEVRKLLGRKPDKGLEDKTDYALETYSWPRGILVKSYFVKVIYRKQGDKVLLHEVVHNVEPTQNDLPNPPLAVSGDEETLKTGTGDDSTAEDEDPPATTDPTEDDAPATDEPATDDSPVSGETEATEGDAATE